MSAATIAHTDVQRERIHALRQDSRVFLRELLPVLFPDGFGGLNAEQLFNRAQAGEVRVWPTRAEQYVLIRAGELNLYLFFIARRKRWRGAYVLSSEWTTTKWAIRKDTGGAEVL